MTHFNFVMTVGALTLSALLPLQAGAASIEDLQLQLNAQQRTMLEQQNQLSQLKAELSVMRGEIETLRYELSKAASGSQGVAAGTAAPATAVTAPANTAVASGTAAAAGTGTAATSSSAPTSAAAAAVAPEGNLTLKQPDATARSAYEAAYAKVSANDFAGAVTAFNNYVAAYPDNTLTPNAWYWLGQVQYRQNNYEAARVSFLNVARFTSSAKRPDALYKLGLISKAKGDKEKAQRYFNLVINTYPADTSANMARKELSSL